ncbi:MFS transporter [Candidatus Gottesmanbacteria bacterium]|nr:MFS transporter [Candidatus Gottesmanbacteria bacterium]
MLNSYISVIKNTNFRNIWLGQITSQISLNMLIFVLAIMVYQTTRSSTVVSLMLLCFAIPSVIFGVVAGGIVDFYDKRIVLLLCNISRVFIFIGFFLFANNILAIFILAILISISTQFFIPAEAPSIPNLVEPSQILTANSLFTISFYLSTVLGFILSGPMIRLFGETFVYLFMGSLMILATAFIYLLPSIKATKGKSKINITFSLFTDTTKEGLLFIRENIRVRQSLLLLTFSQALIATLAVLGPGFSDRILNIDLKDASYLIMGPAAIGLVLGAFWVGGFGNRYLKGTIILLGMWGVAFCLLLLSLLTKAGKPSIGLFIYFLHRRFVLNNLMMAIGLLFFLGIFNSFVSVPANAILQSDSDTKMQGRIYGVLTSLTGGVSILPGIFSGILADVAGVGRALSVIGVLVLISGIYHYLQRRKVNTTIN